MTQTTETQKPKICPFMSKPINVTKQGPIQPYKQWEPYNVPCRKERCELWDTGGEMCSHRAVSNALWEVVDELRTSNHLGLRQ